MDKHHKREESMKYVTTAFNEKLTAPMDYSFTAGGRSHSLACTEDCLVASAQRYKKAAEGVLADVRQEDDYYKEQSALRLVELLEAHELLSVRFSEIHQSYPESVLEMMEQLPALKSLGHAGAKVWENIKDKV